MGFGSAGQGDGTDCGKDNGAVGSSTSVAGIDGLFAASKGAVENQGSAAGASAGSSLLGTASSYQGTEGRLKFDNLCDILIYFYSCQHKEESIMHIGSNALQTK